MYFFRSLDYTGVDKTKIAENTEMRTSHFSDWAK